MIFKRHKLNWMTLLCITIISLIIVLSIGAALDMWDLTYTVLITISFIFISYLLKGFNEIHLEKLVVNRNQNRKKIKIHSILLSTLAGLIYVTPMLIFIIFISAQVYVINIYMLVALYIVIVTSYYVCLIIENKNNDKPKQVQQEE